ncbi:cell division protein ZapA [Pseudorhodobacter antarcticus]|jgi:cell division protein ZapA|uniref:Cell division protein ZapA n=1 Tax=Pseudorhodobacter antarcticus TaxID=1077947 RepID=A0A1H8BQN3_9RHOB|nr:cell division protein ZapA [Pseudorhodobacter antarcticus]SEM84217.1 cell division protein ZapA [Pseudorhodobacter antarcticus]
MAELEITIGGRSFMVACQEGEEHFLRTAAAMLDTEAQPLVAQMGRLPEARMLLMSGLMLADRTASVEDQLRVLQARVEELENRPLPEPQKIQVSVIPPQIPETMAEIAARAEALARKIEDRIAG